MKKFIIKEELAQEILNYLASKPYAEVFRYIQGLSILEPIPLLEEEKEIQ